MMLLSYTPVKIDDHRHEKMKQLAGNARGAIINEYRKAIDLYVENKTKENIILDSKIEEFISERVTKAENHLASMMGRTGMDVSMVLMGLILFLEKFFDGKVTREQIQEKLRKDGARYFTTAIKKDKDNKKGNLQI